MDKEKIILAIHEQLEDIREQFDIIKNHDGKIPIIEIDLIMSNLRDIYESFIHLEKISRPVISFEIENQHPVPETAAVRHEVPEESRVAPPVPETIEKAEEKMAEPEPEAKAVEVEEVMPEPEPETRTPVVEEIQAEPEPMATVPEVEEKEDHLPEPEPVAEEEEEEPEPTPPPVMEVAPEPVAEVKMESPREEQSAKTTLDLFGEPSDTLADRLKDNNEKRIADTLKADKIIDIKSAIGINEKFLFINELFDGSLKNYEDSISKLNACQTNFQAGQVLTELQTTFGWDAENTTARSFIDLVNRKF